MNLQYKIVLSKNSKMCQWAVKILWVKQVISRNVGQVQASKNMF